MTLFMIILAASYLGSRLLFLVDSNFIEEQVSLTACTRMPLRKYRSILSDDVYITCLRLVEAEGISLQHIVLAAFSRVGIAFEAILV